MNSNVDVIGMSSGMLGASLGVYVIVFLLIVFFFIWRAKNSITSAFGVLLLLGVSLSLPVSLQILSKQTNVGTKATSSTKVLNYSVSKVSENKFNVVFQTSEPVIAYVQYRDSSSNEFVPVLPVYTLDKRNSHMVTITTKSAKGGVAYLMISGEAVYPDGKEIVVQ